MATELMVCKETFWTTVDGVRQLFTAGRTHVTSDSNVCLRFPDRFKVAEAQYRSDVEEATAAPGERRAVKV